jgi:hypothetical protein
VERERTAQCPIQLRHLSFLLRFAFASLSFRLVRLGARVAGRFPRRVGAASTPISLRVEFLMTKPFLLGNVLLSFCPVVPEARSDITDRSQCPSVVGKKSRLGDLGGLGWFASCLCTQTRSALRDKYCPELNSPLRVSKSCKGIPEHVTTCIVQENKLNSSPSSLGLYIQYSFYTVLHE